MNQALHHELQNIAEALVDHIERQSHNRHPISDAEKFWAVESVEFTAEGYLTTLRHGYEVANIEDAEPSGKVLSSSVAEWKATPIVHAECLSYELFPCDNSTTKAEYVVRMREGWGILDGQAEFIGFLRTPIEEGRNGEKILRHWGTPAYAAVGTYFRIKY